jgi:protein-S-isoprenylcysteine O-methyltransferase Ste14
MHTATVDRAPLRADDEVRVAAVSTELFGARDLLSALGWKPNLINFFRFSGLIFVLMLGFLGATVLIGDLIPVPASIFQVFLWAGWLYWLGHVLPRHQMHDLSMGSDAYRRAFWRELCFGIGFNFAMLLRPLTEGILYGDGMAGTPWILAVGLLLSGLGVISILEGSRQLGVSCAFFVYEYSPNTTPPVINGGVYGLLRHPLFAGGICMSVGLGICVSSPVALELAAVNAAILLPYLAIEDHRCSDAVGSRYRRYREEVNGILPRTRRNLDVGEASQGQRGSSQGKSRENPADRNRIHQMRARQTRRQ